MNNFSNFLYSCSACQWIPNEGSQPFKKKLVDFCLNSFWTWLPDIFFKFSVSLSLISTWLEIWRGIIERQFFFFISMILGVFWKDNAKDFLNHLSKGPLPISKWAEIALKDTQNYKYKIFLKPSSEAVLANFYIRNWLTKGSRTSIWYLMIHTTRYKKFEFEINNLEDSQQQKTTIQSNRGHFLPWVKTPIFMCYFS